MPTDSRQIEMLLWFMFGIVCFGIRQFSGDDKLLEQFDFRHYEISNNTTFNALILTR